MLTVDLRRLGPTEVERIHESLLALAPVSALVLDFRRAGDLEPEAVSMLGQVLDGLDGIALELRGVTLRQARLLEAMRRGRDGWEPDAAGPWFVLDLRRGARSP